MDKEAVRAGSEHLWVPASFISKGQIDEYAKYLQDFVLDLVEKTVPTAKSHQEASTPRCRWWTSEVDKAVKEERREKGRLETGGTRLSQLATQTVADD